MYLEISSGSPLSTRYPQDGNEAPTAVVHAAHGGLESFRLVIHELSKTNREGSSSLDYALAINDGVAGRGEDNERQIIRTRRQGMLLAEAASGGDTRVLRAVVSAIEVRQ